MKIPVILKDQRRGLFIRLVINGLIQAGLTISTAWIVKEIFDRFLLTQHLMLNFDVIGFGIALIVIAACIGWLRMVERLDAEQIGQNYIAETRILLYDYFCTLAPRSIQKRSRGTVLLRFVSDMTALKRWISLGLSRLTVAGVSTLTALFILAIINWQLTLAVTLSLVTGGYIAYALGSRLRIAARETRRRLSYLAANLSDKVANIAVVQLFDQVGRERERIIRQNKQLHDSMIERARVAGQIHGITEFSAAVTSAIALFTGIIAVASGEATVGSVVAAITVVGILMPPLRELGRVQEYWHGACVSREKLKTFLETPSFVTEISNAPALNITSGRLEFDSVTVSGGIKQLSGSIEPGQVVALVGPNGAGKSTLLQLAARLIDPDEGKILLDGQDLSQHSLKSIRRSIGMASPDLPLLRGSIEKNLRYRWRNVPEEEIIRVKTLCGIDEILAQLPNGAKTKLSEGGTGLSTGQRQRIALARALLGNPLLLLLDEVDANLDAQASMIIDRIIAEHHGTILLATHQLKHIKAADIVWYLEGGQLIEAGPPNKILYQNGPTVYFLGLHQQSAAN